MQVFRIAAAPSFRATVGIHVPGQDEKAQLAVVFRALPRRQTHAFSALLIQRLDLFKAAAAADALADTPQVLDLEVKALTLVIETWDGIEGGDGNPLAYGEAALGLLLDNFHGAFDAIVEAYFAGLREAREKN